MIDGLLQNAIFGVALTLIAYEFGKFVQWRTQIKVLPPLITGAALIIAVLLIFDIDYNTYQNGASIVSFFLGPATVSFAIPLYKNLYIIKKNIFPILIGILGGSIAGLLSVYLLCSIFDINELITLSMLPKSVTSAIGFAVAEMIGGVPEITLILISIAGITGYMVGPIIFKLLKVDNPVIKGISLGTSSHIIGTAKAMELGEEEGALSTAAITVAGVMMVFLVPLFMKVFM